ncbi:MAG: crossover junction endodeoxyribonuclease RuvC [Meiothermus sp.]|uniref:crossover junction endodeoxyribonuclease RuvC n=1 Tax=Meiothermus sp. TaxID=1955249 RepID=UPI0025E21939|nr:crossover junction endodeoxyribonuclease RuvC [Meiothermus sp.]MCS7057751.1 crossover junction endodeoxyribonuclease RuvC [Meiothermus sp.]MCS7194478.1 crossover junction endodeoxyribonuclease RuvC [Meiothermus sp.]MDW8091572.1 crossover junction endodeoxyribonuclease RuvC [Meiothermus sp.]MDW8482318.1 crossover junction endodeoxyribonuclease RuvC [Meiothermus sp.]
MVVLGIDPGITNLGLGVVEQTGQRYRMLHGQVIQTAHGQPAPERVGKLYRAVYEAARLYQPQAISVEEQFFYRQNELAYKVGWAMGVVFLVADQMSIPVYGYGPPQVKQALVGSGNADKQQIAYMVRALLGLPSLPRPTHLADALAIALTHCFHQRLRSNEPLR